MVTRTYNAPEFNVQDTRQFRQDAVQQADTRVNPGLTVGDSAWRDNLLVSLGKTGIQLADKATDIELSNQYLEGQAQAGIAASEDELQGNPLTRDWKVAGYRDTMGKLALADNEAQFQLDLPKLRESGSEDIQKYLAERRNKLMPGLASMSQEAKAAATGQMLLQDRAATKSWAGEHAKFIIETKGQAVATTWQTALSSLEATQMKVATGEASMEAMQEQLRSTTGNILGNVWFDKSLPDDVQKEWTFNMVQQALAKDNVNLYDYLAANDIADGTGGTLIGRLTGEQQLKLSNQYREAMSRTSDMRNMSRMEQIAKFESALDNNEYSGTYQDVQDTFRPMVLNKTITGERYQALVNKYLDKGYKNESSSLLSGSLLRGDINAIYNSGKTIPDAVDAMEVTMAKNKMSPERRLDTWLNVGLSGVEQGFKKAGESLGVSVRQILNSKDGTVLPQHAAVFRQINDSLRKAEAAGLTNTRTQLLSGMGEEDRMFTEQIMRRVDTGATLEEAITNAREVAVKDAALTPSAKAARSTGTAAEINKQINTLEPRGLLESIWAGTKAAFGSSDAAADLKIRPRTHVSNADGIFGDSPTIQFYTEQMRTELRAEAGNVAFLRPSASADEVLTVAKANLAARTISTEHGPIAMPRNVNLQTVFGVSAANQPAIGKAIDGLLKETKADSSYQMVFQQGRLFAQEYDKQGTRIGNGMYIDPADVRARIKQDSMTETEKANQRMGSGKIRKAGEALPPNAPEQGVHNGASGKIRKAGSDVAVQYNGINTAGVPTDWAFDFRDNLIKHEGIRDTPYADLSGSKMTNGKPIMTVGVGVSSHNARYPEVGPDGKVSSEAISTSFRDASNDASVAGARVAKDLGKDSSKHAFMLFSELAYQSGTDFLSQDNRTGERYREFAVAYKSNDVDVAKEAFKRTAAWYYSRDPKNPEKVTGRQDSYLKLIEASMKG